MMSGVLLFEEKISAQSVDCLRDIEHIVGRACLTGGYTKLVALVRTCTKIGEASKADAESDMACIQSCVLFACQALRFGLRHEFTDPTSITNERLEPPKKDGPPSTAHVLVARKFMLGHVRSALEEIRGVADAVPHAGRVG